MYNKNENQMASSQVDTIIDNGTVKLEILNDDVLRLVRNTEAIGTDFSEQINNNIRLFNILMDNTNLPEFTAEEKCVIANCLTGSIVNDIFIKFLDVDVYDYLNDCYDLASPDEPALLEECKALVAKINNLDFIQRVKLVYTVYREFF